MKDNPLQPLSIQQILTALLNEVVRSRVRNRALLRVLANNATLQMREYIEAYRTEEEESFGALSDMLTLAPQEFRAKHEEWLERDRATFGYQAESYRGVQLLSETEFTSDRNAATPPAALPEKVKTRKRTRKSVNS